MMRTDSRSRHLEIRTMLCGVISISVSVTRQTTFIWNDEDHKRKYFFWFCLRDGMRSRKSQRPNEQETGPQKSHFYGDQGSRPCAITESKWRYLGLPQSKITHPRLLLMEIARRLPEMENTQWANCKCGNFIKGINMQHQHLSSICLYLAIFA